MPHREAISPDLVAKLGPSYALLLQLAHYSPSLVALCNLDGELIYLNPAGRRLIGVDNADIFPQRIIDYVVPEQRAMVFAEIVPTARETGVWQGRMQLINSSNARIIDVERTSFRIQNAAGDVTGFVSVMHESAADTRLNSPLAADESSRRGKPVGSAITDQFFHDFNNMLASVHSGFCAIERRVTDPAVSAIAVQGKNVAHEGLTLIKRLRSIFR